MKKQKETPKTASKTKTGLNLKQEAFCQAYVSFDKEKFGNGTQCYLDVYGLVDEKTGKKIGYMAAMAAASRLLTNVKIVNRINELLTKEGFNDENVDKQLLAVINQHADFKSKVMAIKEYNNLKARIQKKIDLTSGGKPIPIYGSQSTGEV
jgi:hypothetical protein